MVTPTNPILDALWKRATDNWDDEAAHGAFLEYCREHNCLVEAAVRYRGMSADRDRHALAEKKLKAVALLAMTELEAARSRPISKSAARRPGGVALILFFIAATVGLLAYLKLLR